MAPSQLCGLSSPVSTLLSHILRLCTRPPFKWPRRRTAAVAAASAAFAVVLKLPAIWSANLHLCLFTALFPTVADET
jgi:hypothetical protein